MDRPDIERFRAQAEFVKQLASDRDAAFREGRDKDALALLEAYRREQWSLGDMVPSLLAYIEALEVERKQTVDAIEYALSGLKTLGMNAWPDVCAQLEAQYRAMTGRGHRERDASDTR